MNPDINKSMRNIVNDPEIDDIMVDVDGVKEALNKMKNNTAIGPDGVPVECLKKRGTFILEAMVDRLRTSMDEGYVPEAEILKVVHSVSIFQYNTI